MIKLRNFIAPQNAAEGEQLTLESVKAAFGISDTTPPPAADPPAAEPPADNGGQADPPAEPNTPPSQEPPAGDPPAEPPAADPPPIVDKSQQAFAQQRIQIKNYEKTLSGIAKIVGVTDTSDPEALMSKLNDVILKAEAKNTGVPEEVYKRLQTLEERNNEFTQKQVQEAAYFGFQKVKDEFKLDDAGLNKFAQDLIKAGANPFETPMDLVREYKLMHMDDIIKAAKEEGIRAEAERAAKAANHSSTPNNKQGQGGSDPEKITTVAQLNSWFDQHQTQK